MEKIIFFSFVALLIMIILYLICVIIIPMFKNDSTKKFSDHNEDLSRHSDLIRWRGGVRYPLGYYKNDYDFYSVESSLKYPDKKS